MYFGQQLGGMKERDQFTQATVFLLTTAIADIMGLCVQCAEMSPCWRGACCSILWGRCWQQWCRCTEPSGCTVTSSPPTSSTSTTASSSWQTSAAPPRSALSHLPAGSARPFLLLPVQFHYLLRVLTPSQERPSCAALALSAPFSAA